MNNPNPTSPDFTSKEMLSRYQQGELSAAERHAMEKASLDDPLLAEAMEGSELLTGAELNHSLASLQSQMADRLGQSGSVAGKPLLPWRSLSIAASILLLVVSGWWLSGSLQKETAQGAISMETEVAPQDTPSASPPPPPSITATEPTEEPAVGLGEGTAITETEALGSSGAIPPPAAIEFAQADDVPEAELMEVKEEPATSTASEVTALPSKAADAVMEAEPTIDNTALIAEARRQAEAADEVPVIASEVSSTKQSRSADGIDVTVDGSYIESLSDEPEATVSMSADEEIAASLSKAEPDVEPVVLTSFSDLALTDSTLAKEQIMSLKSAKKETNSTGASASHLADFDRPQPTVGTSEYDKYLSKEVNALLKKHPIKGKEEITVLLRFMVDEAGQPYAIELIGSPGEPWSADLQRILSDGPAWIPAAKNGTVQPVSVTLSVILN